MESPSEGTLCSTPPSCCYPDAAPPHRGGEMDAQVGTDVEMGFSPAALQAKRRQEDLMRLVTNEFNRKRREDRYLTVTKRRDAIFRVPANLREQDPKAYEPRVVAIGPYHRGNPRLQPMEAVKRKVGYRLVSAQPSDGAVERCFEKLVAEGSRARQCYPDLVAMEDADFILMMFLDGCCIIQILLLEEAKELLIAKKLAVAPEELINHLFQVRYDFLLLENQLPLFIIELIFESFARPIAPRADLGRLIGKLFSRFQPQWNVHSPVLPGKVHLLHLFHQLIVPSHVPFAWPPPPPPPRAAQPAQTQNLSNHASSAPSPPGPRPETPPPTVIAEETYDDKLPSDEIPRFANAAELEKAGVNIKKKEGGEGFPVEFNDRHGILRILPISVNYYSKVFFRNLIALEQCQPGVKTLVTAYAAFLGCLVETERDVTILQSKGIILNSLSTAQETAAFFNSLWRETWHTEATPVLQSLLVKLRRYCETVGGGGPGAAASSHAAKRRQDLSRVMDAFNRKREEHRDVLITKQHGAFCMVPPNLRGDESKVYEPRVVAIGPCHRDNPRLRPMEEVKDKVVHRFTQPYDAIKRLFARLLEEEDRARRYYSDLVAMDVDEFILMMFRDGCFIIQILLLEDAKESKKGGATPAEPQKPTLHGQPPEELINQLLQVQFDLLLVENQIPFFIIEFVFEIVFKNVCPTVSLTRLIYTMFTKLQPHKGVYAPVLRGDSLLHLFHRSLVPPDFGSNQSRAHSTPQPRPKPEGRSNVVVPPAPPPPPPFPGNPLQQSPLAGDDHKVPSVKLTWFPNAVELEKAGVVIEKKEDSNILDVEFDDRHGVLRIPALYINDYSKTLFRNLIALEQLHPRVNTHITAYAAFLGCLIKTETDVRMLQRKDIILNCLSTTQETAAFFNTLWRETWHTEATSELQGLFTKLRMYCRRRWPSWRAGLCRDYFGNPWAIISVIAAVVLLLLTIIQTIFTAYPFFRP